MILLFAIAALLGILIVRRETVSKIRQMDSLSSFNFSSSKEGECARDIWNKMGNERKFSTTETPCPEETDLLSMMESLSLQEQENILDEVLKDE